MDMSGWKIIATISLAILVLIANKLWEPIAGYVGYPFDGRRRVKDLVDVVEWLCAMRKDLLRLDPKLSSKETAHVWEERVKDLCGRTREIKTGYDGCGRLNYLNKCYFAREADMELKSAADLTKRGEDLLKEAQARPLRVRDLLWQNRPQNQLRGMDSYMDKVQNFIQGRSTSRQQSGPLGIWGMPGVGKSSLLELVRDSHSPCVHAAPFFFDHVLFVRAGRGATVDSMQKAIADSIGLHVTMPDDEISQGSIIYNHLKDKSFLLLIDDLWERQDLGHVGIPMPLGSVEGHLDRDVVRQCWRKVVFTTRSNDVCGQMGCANNAIRLECMSKGDAWELFVDNVGKEIIDDPQLHKLARKLVDECGGLPMALCTIGRTMSTRTYDKEWICAIDLLKDSKLLEINKDTDLIKSVQSSYDHMQDNLKNCFLTTLLWPRGENIPKEKLVEWWTGLGLLDVTNAINKGCMIINDLLRASMLEKGDTNLYSSENSHVKIHGVTREMVLWIVKDTLLPLSFCRSALPEEKWKTVQKAWISALDSSGWTSTSSVRCPQLTMLVARHAFSFEAPTCFESITFLDLKGTTMHEFPTAVCSLETLQYLNLSATAIAALPKDLHKLSNLKYLYIRDIKTLQTVPTELISQLAKLLVLDLFCSGTNSNEGQYFSSLIEGFSGTGTDLTLGITVHTEQDILKLTGALRMAVHTQALCMHLFQADKQLIISTIILERLCFMEKLRELTITNSPDIKHLVATESTCTEYGLLPYLEFLELRNLLKLEKVTWKNAGLSIRVIVIHSCTKLRHVTWVQCLKKLEELTIAYCPELEKVIDNEEILQDMMVADQLNSFGQLKKLYLEELPKLSIISEHSRPFEKLSYVFVARCENLKIIRVGQRRNHNKIKIDCNEGWWTSVEDKEGIMGLHFVPTICS